MSAACSAVVWLLHDIDDFFLAILQELDVFVTVFVRNVIVVYNEVFACCIFICCV